MPNVQIREVPEDVHNELVRRAEVAGQSLQIPLNPTGRDGRDPNNRRDDRAD